MVFHLVLADTEELESYDDITDGRKLICYVNFPFHPNPGMCVLAGGPPCPRQVPLRSLPCLVLELHSQAHGSAIVQPLVQVLRPVVAPTGGSPQGCMGSGSTVHPGQTPCLTGSPPCPWYHPRQLGWCRAGGRVTCWMPWTAASKNGGFSPLGLTIKVTTVTRFLSHSRSHPSHQWPVMGQSVEKQEVLPLLGHGQHSQAQTKESQSRREGPSVGTGLYILSLLSPSSPVPSSLCWAMRASEWEGGLSLLPSHRGLAPSTLGRNGRGGKGAGMVA
jgi:hypothetical protein